MLTLFTIVYLILGILYFRFRYVPLHESVVGKMLIPTLLMLFPFWGMLAVFDLLVTTSELSIVSKVKRFLFGGFCK